MSGKVLGIKIIKIAIVPFSVLALFLLSGQSAYAVEPVTSWTQTSNPSNWSEDPRGVARDSTGIYVVGHDRAQDLGDPQWRIEKRRLDTGASIWSQVSNKWTKQPQFEFAMDVAVDGTGVYVVGYAHQKTGDIGWRIEKRNKDTGAIIWSQESNPSASDDFAYGVAVDGTGVYVVGFDSTPGNTQWRIEKRRLDTGASIWSQNSNPSSANDFAYDVAVDGTGIYVVGSDGSSGAPNYKWRIEKRRLDTGASIWLQNSTVTVPSYDALQGVAVDGTGIYIAGYDTISGDPQWRIEKRRLDTGALVWSQNSNPSSAIDDANGVAVDGSGVYVVGKDRSPGHYQWRTEKRNLGDGSLVWSKVSDPSFSADDIVYDVAADGTCIYVVGDDFSLAYTQWRMEKYCENNNPNIPTLKAPPNDVWINSNPTFTATVSDSDGNNVQAYFNFSQITGNPAPPADQNGTTVSSGSDSTWTPSPALSDGEYWWRAKTIDQYSLESSYSGYWKVKKDTLNPNASCNAPTVNGATVSVTVFSNDPAPVPAGTASGVATGDLDLRISSGAWQNASSLTSGTYSTSGNPGETYEFRYRVQDNAVNWSNGGSYQSCGSVLIPPTGVTIQGRHVDQNGNPFDVPGVTERVTVSGPVNNSTTTTPSWSFSNITAGTYTVTADLIAGYQISYSVCTNCSPPTASYTNGNSLQVNLPIAGNYADIYFKYTSLVTIQGRHRNFDGTSDLVLPGQQVTVSGPFNGSSTASPAWDFSNKPTGTYTVTAANITGYTTSYTYCINNCVPVCALPVSGTGNSFSITLSSPGNYSDVYFKYTPAVTIQGRHVKSDGSLFDNPAVRVTISGPVSDFRNYPPATWNFTNIPAGTYTVTADLITNYQISYSVCTNCSPPTASYTNGNSLQVTLSSAGNYADIYFKYTLIPCPASFNPSSPVSPPNWNNARPTFTWLSGGQSHDYVISYQVQMRKGNANFDIGPKNGYWYATTTGNPPNLFLSYPGTWNRFNDPNSSSDPNGTPPGNGLADTGVGTYYWRVKATNSSVPPCVTLSSVASFDYAGQAAWFQIQNGNVGTAGGKIEVTPPQGKKVVTYTGIAKQAFDPLLSESSWGVSTYGDWSVQRRATFDYFWSQIGSQATEIADITQIQNCPDPALYCIFKFSGTELKFGNKNLTVTKPIVLFVGIPGDPKSNLILEGDLTLGGGQAVFIIEGNLTMSRNSADPQLVDGFFATDGLFTSSSTNVSKLTVNGGVIAHGGVNLQRTLGPAGNSEAAENFIFQPSYLVNFAQLVGAPTRSWKERVP